jgi:peptidyl-prolyl cis-trans isomerase C
MTTSFPVTKTGMRRGLASAALTSVFALALLAGPVRAEDANPVLAKVNGAEIRKSDLTLAEEELARVLRRWIQRPRTTMCCLS